VKSIEYGNGEGLKQKSSADTAKCEALEERQQLANDRNWTELRTQQVRVEVPGRRRYSLIRSFVGR